MEQENILIDKNLRAWVVFCKDTDIWWLRFLKRGYRHCFVIINDGYNWITYDPTSAWTELKVQKTPITFDLPKWFSEQGNIIIKTLIQKRYKLAPISFYTCVESIKRVLGIHNFFIFTPYQLHKYLIERNKKWEY